MVHLLRARPHRGSPPSANKCHAVHLITASGWEETLQRTTHIFITRTPKHLLLFRHARLTASDARTRTIPPASICAEQICQSHARKLHQRGAVSSHGVICPSRGATMPVARSKGRHVHNKLGNTGARAHWSRAHPQCGVPEKSREKSREEKRRGEQSREEQRRRRAS